MRAHTVFLRFSNLVLTNNLSPSTAADLIRASLNRAETGSALGNIDYDLKLHARCCDKGVEQLTIRMEKQAARGFSTTNDARAGKRGKFAAGVFFWMRSV